MVPTITVCTSTRASVDQRPSARTVRLAVAYGGISISIPVF